jgi:hypothetical protein
LGLYGPAKVVPWYRAFLEIGSKQTDSNISFAGINKAHRNLEIITKQESNSANKQSR